jgi:hypothetical protein
MNFYKKNSNRLIGGNENDKSKSSAITGKLGIR